MVTGSSASLCVYCGGSPGCVGAGCTATTGCKKEISGSNNDIGGCNTCAAGTCP